jgi:hypothetical protein
MVVSNDNRKKHFADSSYKALESKFHKSNAYYLKSLVKKIFIKNLTQYLPTHIFCKKSSEFFTN